MITLKEALHLPQEEIIELKKDLTLKINASNIGAYVEQHTGDTIATSGDGVPIMIKDNIQVDGWNIACASKILEGYIADRKSVV